MLFAAAQMEPAATGVTAAEFAAAGWNKWLATSTAALVRCPCSSHAWSMRACAGHRARFCSAVPAHSRHMQA